MWGREPRRVAGCSLANAFIDRLVNFHRPVEPFALEFADFPWGVTVIDRRAIAGIVKLVIDVGGIEGLAYRRAIELEAITGRPAHHPVERDGGHARALVTTPDVRMNPSEPNLVQNFSRI